MREKKEIQTNLNFNCWDTSGHHDFLLLLKKISGDPSQVTSSVGGKVNEGTKRCRPKGRQICWCEVDRERSEPI